MIAKLCSAALALAAVTFFSGTAQAQSKMTLRFVDSLPASHLFTRELAKPWMDAVTAATKGAVTFEHYPAEQLGKAKDMLSLTQSGVADVAFVTPIYISDKLPHSGVVDLPGGFTTSCQGLKAFWSMATGDGVLAKQDFAANGVRVLLAVVQPPFQVFTSNKKIATLSDLEGLKLRTAGGAQDITATRLKVVSVKLTAPETGEAMTRGTIDGGILAHVSIGAYGLTNLIKYATAGENFGSAALTWSISEAKWKTLPPEVQKAMTEAGERLTLATCKKVDQEVEDALASWRAKGVNIVTFNEQDRTSLRKVFEGIGDDWAKGLDQRGKSGSETLRAFRAALGSKS